MYAVCVWNFKSTDKSLQFRPLDFQFGLWCTAVHCTEWNVDKVCGHYCSYAMSVFNVHFWTIPDPLCFHFFESSKLNVYMQYIHKSARCWSNLNISAWNLFAVVTIKLHARTLYLSSIHSLLISLTLVDFSLLLPILLARYVWPSTNSHIPYERFLLAFFISYIEKKAFMWVWA